MINTSHITSQMITIDLLTAYLVHRDIEETLTYLTQNAVWIDISKTQLKVANTYNEIYDYIKEEIHRDQNTNEIHMNWCQSTDNGDGSEVFYGEFMIKPENIEDENHRLVSLTVVLQLQSEEKKISYVHISNKKEEGNQDQQKVIQCVSTDITALQSDRQILEKEKDQYNKIAHLFASVIIEYDTINDVMVFSNSDLDNKIAYETIYNYTKEVEKSRFFFEKDKRRYLEFLKTQTQAALEYQCYDTDGKLIWSMAHAFVIKDSTGRVIRLIGSINNSDVQKKESEFFSQQNKRDCLTRLYNKYTTKSEINAYLKSQSNHKDHIILLVDIDNFTLINQQLGHLFGDSVLRNISDCLRDFLVNSNILGRVGGDKFLILLKNTRIEEAVQKADELRTALRNIYVGENQTLKVTASIGIAGYPEYGTDYDELFQNASRALSNAKENGKDMTIVCEGDEGSELSNEDCFHQLIQEQNYDNKQVYNKDITSFALELLENTKDEKSAIHLLLGEVGKRFQLSMITIREAMIDTRVMVCTYHWSKDNLDAIVKECLQYTDFLWEEMIDRYDKESLIYISDTSDYNILEEDEKRIQEYQIKSTLQFPIYQEGTFRGAIYFDNCYHKNSLNCEEINTLKDVSKIISNCILRIQAVETASVLVEQLTNYDSLTKLPNLTKFHGEASSIMLANPTLNFAVVYSDINNFKYINNIFGYMEGDQVLCDYADTLLESCGLQECVGRITADQFLVLFRAESKDELKRRILKMNDSFSMGQKKKSNSSSLYITSGAYLLEQGDDNITQAIDYANLARKSIKGIAKNDCAFFNKSMEEKMTSEMKMTNQMFTALENGEFQVYLQPKVSLDDHVTVGAEALVRWVKKDCDIIPPDAFIPLFERNGFIVNLDFCVYEEVCRYLSHRIKNDLPIVPISVNVSRIHLLEGSFVEKFTSLVKKYEIPPHLLELELTESIFFRDTDIAIRMMHQLRDFGFEVSIDDFGSGYSSLHLLKKLKADVLKIDKAFFTEGAILKEDEIIISSIINMAKNLNMKVLCEGIETKKQVNFLAGLNCDMVQGYYFSRPVPMDQLKI